MLGISSSIPKNNNTKKMRLYIFHFQKTSILFWLAHSCDFWIVFFFEFFYIFSLVTFLKTVFSVFLRTWSILIWHVDNHIWVHCLNKWRRIESLLVFYEFIPLCHFVCYLEFRHYTTCKIVWKTGFFGMSAFFVDFFEKVAKKNLKKSSKFFSPGKK